MSDRDATIELYRPENEAEALGIEAELREHRITPVLERRASTAYPGIVDRSGWGVIRVAAADAPRAKILLDAWLAERGTDEMDEEELALAAMEADDVDPAEIRRRRVELARADRGGAYRAGDDALAAKTRSVALAPPPAARPRWSTLLLLASIGLNVVLLWHHLRALEARDEGDAEELRCPSGAIVSCP